MANLYVLSFEPRDTMLRNTLFISSSVAISNFNERIMTLQKICVFENLYLISEKIKDYKQLHLNKNMVKEVIGGRPANIEKDGNSIKVTFHPISENAKHPDAKVFSIRLSKKDLDLLKKSL